MIAAPVWHYWLGLILFILAIGGVAATLGGYLKMVSSQRYPSRQRGADREL